MKLCANSGYVNLIDAYLVHTLGVCVVTTKRLFCVRENSVRKHYLWLNKSSTSSFPLSYTSQTVLCLIYYITLFLKIFQFFDMFYHILWQARTRKLSNARYGLCFISHCYLECVLIWLEHNMIICSWNKFHMKSENQTIYFHF